ncbi:unnamed protein product [Ambrosiozyma monospora]|uniref:Unnamed protein product n=1 Tax=Ambrosiozyma monospora TaxID=43982 RepID=A0ACB5TH98_AMBMO|nr:unnamed protein product [Ambrosiozyma monospora]
MGPTVITGFDANGDMSGLKRAFSETEKNQFDPTFGKRYPPQTNHRGGRTSGITRQHQYQQQQQQQRQHDAENNPDLGVLNGDATGGDQYLPSSSINGFQSSQTQIQTNGTNVNGQIDHSVINNENSFNNHQRQRSKSINLANGIEDEYIPGLVSFDFHAWVDEEAVSFDESEPTHQHNHNNLPHIPLQHPQQLQPTTSNAVTVPSHSHAHGQFTMGGTDPHSQPMKRKKLLESDNESQILSELHSQVKPIEIGDSINQTNDINIGDVQIGWITRERR